MLTKSQQIHSATEPMPDLRLPQVIAATEWLDGGIAILDKEGLVVSMNDPLARWLGRPPAERSEERRVGKECA